MRVYDKYFDEQKKHPNAIIALRLGDFYEVFGFGAKIVANKLNFTLTGRDCGTGERVYMVGFPFCMLPDVAEKMKEDFDFLAVE